MDSGKRNTMRKLSGAALALTAAGLFATGTVAPVAMADEAKVHCAGVNSCKGKSECATSDNSCKGQNSCKGKGWVPLTEKQCTDKGGKVSKS
jgi:hypothetical protein